MPLMSTAGNLNSFSPVKIKSHYISERSLELSCRTEDKGLKGFTLMEMIIVVLLLSIFLVVSVPSLRQSVLNDPLRRDARKLIGALKNVRLQAKTEQQALIVYCDLDDGRIWYGTDNPVVTEGESEIDVQLTLSEDVSIRSVMDNSGELVDRGIAELWVSSRGYMEKSVVHLESDGEEITLLIETFVPDIRVIDGYAELE